MKKPSCVDVRQSVCRNSGGVGCRNCGHRPRSVSNSQPGRVDDRLGLVRVDRADRVDDRAARPHALRGGAEELELQLGQRLGAPAEVGPGGEHAEPRARRVDERAVEPVSSAGSVASVGVRRRGRCRRRAGATFSSSSRARPRSPPPRRPRRASIVVFPPGAAQRSSTRSPGCDADDEAGELRAAALRPDLAALRALSRRRASTSPGVRNVRSDPAGTGPGHV